MPNNTKKVKLRLFVINHTFVSTEERLLITLLQSKIENSRVRTRCMPLSINNPDTEKDVLLDCTVLDNNVVKGLMLRFAPAEGTPSIDNSIFERQKLNLNEIVTASNRDEYIEKSHYYFYIKDNLLVTNLQSNIVISRFEAYINWLLEDVRGDNSYSFTPKLAPPPSDLKMADLKMVTMKRPILKQRQSESGSVMRSVDVTRMAIEDVVSAVPDIEKLIDDEIITARLVLKINKPRKLSESAYQEQYGFLMKEISESENIVFKTRDGSSFTGAQISITKESLIEKTDSGNINEQQLYLEMERFCSQYL